MYALSHSNPDSTYGVYISKILSQETIALFVWLIRHQPAVLFSQNKPATSYFSLRTNQHQPSATSQTNRLYILQCKFLAWSLSNISLGSSTPALLNKRTHHACGQPHGIRTGFILREDLESNLDLVFKFSPLSHH
jgi:hypothetical protein